MVLLVTFHGGTSGINNVFAFDTSTGTLLSSGLLSTHDDVQLNELRSVVLANGLLYVANGGATTSDVLCYKLATDNSSATYVSTLIACSLSGQGYFETSVAHPFGLAFVNATSCFVSNQDTNVVAHVNVSNSGQTGSLGRGSQSAYLSKLFPPPNAFLDGTYVASNKGKLRHVTVVAPDVQSANGGLGVKFGAANKVQNSVRDVIAANGILFVCDEPYDLVNMYSVADGSFLGSSNALAGGPTHLALHNGGLFVSAKSHLYWGQLPTSAQSASLSLTSLAVTPPATNTIGGVAFEDGATPTAYVAFQAGTGAATGGSIDRFGVQQDSPSSLPRFGSGSVFVQSSRTTFMDTPEFVVCV